MSTKKKSKKKSSKEKLPSNDTAGDKIHIDYPTLVFNLENGLRVSRKDIRELTYQNRVLEARISSLLYGQTLMEEQKIQDHRIKEELRENTKNTYQQTTRY